MTSGWQKPLSKRAGYTSSISSGKRRANTASTIQPPLEIGILYGLSAASPQVSRYTLILCEEGYDARNIGGMRRGIRPYTEREWRWHDFEDHDEAVLSATQFCYDCLLDSSRSF
ncbi:hypothetical protein [Methanoculleus chikugoensis]|uniref:Uncharacterized protein n=1 Tax=Methanoculleus chikugoensis TaxID=118126 RepID=A0ABM7H7R5_9EURY|nr:hypothetical protein [Methanoculleus chikugoensis]BBL68833.1 hypothetical protein MchiMG62_20140 [Methanoculleus chikugoensis]